MQRDTASPQASGRQVIPPFHGGFIMEITILLQALAILIDVFGLRIKRKPRKRKKRGKK